MTRRESVLAAPGWIEGQNLQIESRYAEGRNDRLAALAAEFVRESVEVIVASTTPGALAAKASSGAIPIVFARMARPVQANLVASLARPGGNVTGVSSFDGEFVLNQFELLRELLPGLKRIALQIDPPNPPGQGTLEALNHRRLRAHRRVRRQDPQGGESRRPSGRAGRAVHDDGESRHCHGARDHDSTVGAGADG